MCLYLIFSVLLLPGISPKETKVEFRLFANQDSDHYESVNATHLGSFPYNASLHYVVICHGWMEGINSVWYHPLVEQFMEKSPDFVVITAGYHRALSAALYFPAVSQVKRVGEIVGTFISTLITEKDIPGDNIEIVGHSLGAHIAGHAGNYTQNTTGASVRRIFGLDPAGPGFYYGHRRLQSGDADRVIAIHTSLVGLPVKMADIDFFPNGGRVQLTCGIPILTDHWTSIYFFFCSINGKCKNVGRLCNSYATYLLHLCKKNPTAEMGYNVDDGTTVGDYYLTVSCSIFSEIAMLFS